MAAMRRLGEAAESHVLLPAVEFFTFRRRPLEGADCVFDSRGFIEINPRDRGYHYRVTDLRNPKVEKIGEQGLEKWVGPQEKEAVLAKARPVIEEEVKRHSKNREFDWLGGISLERWQEVMNKHAASVVADTIEFGCLGKRMEEVFPSGPDNVMKMVRSARERINALKARLSGIDVTGFLDPKLPLSIAEARDLDYERRRDPRYRGDIFVNLPQEAGYLKSKMLEKLGDNVFKEVGLQDNAITKLFFNEAVGRIAKKA